MIITDEEIDKLGEFFDTLDDIMQIDEVYFSLELADPTEY